MGKTGRAEHVSLLDGGDFVVGVEFSHNRVTVARGDVWGRITPAPEGWESVRTTVDADPHASLDVAAGLVRKVVGDRDLSKLVGVGIAVAAPIDPEDQRVLALKGEETPGNVSWVGKHPARELAKRLSEWNTTFLVDNDANLAAQDEYRSHSAGWSRGRPLKDFVHVKWSSGVGSAVIIDEEVRRGVLGLAGEIGHTPVVGLTERPGTRCERCGRFDCLENVVSYDAMKRAVGLDRLSRQEFEEDERGRDRIADAAVYVGRALGQLVNIVNPQAIAISGPSADLHSLIVRQIQVGLSETAVAASANDVEIYVCEPRWGDADDEVGRLAVASGAIHAVIDAHAGSHLLDRLRQLASEATVVRADGAAAPGHDGQKPRELARAAARD